MPEIGQIISHYRVTEKLGAGGMGEVFLADDLSLGRKVALKFLPEDMQQDAAAHKRFLREAKSAAALDHPYICHINEVGEKEGKDFIVMEYVEGQTLKDRIERGLLPLKEALRTGIEVAEGLEEAHAKGIIHRDLKPSNIMLTRTGHAKIMDFGLAKHVIPSGGIGSQEETVTEMTRRGTPVGTLAYMSPEQLRGETADVQSDIFSFGVVLYEMLAEAHPFKKQTAAETVSAILTAAPQPLVELRPDVPILLQHIVRKMLAKDARDRYASAHDVRTDLKELAETPEQTVAAAGKRLGPFYWIAAIVLMILGASWAYFHFSPREVTLPSAGVEQQPSIVVLPFDDISPAHDNEYFVDGLTEEIIGKLSKVRALKVISRTSAMNFKGTSKALRTIAEEVKVRYVLEGSVRRVANSLRISAQLIDAPSDTHLWADQYPGTLDDVFDMQEKVSRAIVEGLKLKLTPTEDRQIARRPIPNVQAYDAYLRARNAVMQFGPEGLNEAQQFLQDSLKLTGDNALLHAGLGYVLFQYANIGLLQEEALKKAEAHAQQALRLDPESAQAHEVLGLVQSSYGDQQQAIRHFKQALSIDPNDSDAMLWLLTTYYISGKSSTARSLADRMTEIDPLNILTTNARAWVNFYDGRFDLSVELFRSCLALHDYPVTRFTLAYTLAATKRTDEALTLLVPIVPTKRSDVVVQSSRFLRLALQNEKGKVPELLSPDFVATMRRDALYSLWVTDFYAMLDDREQTLDWLENAVNRGFINYPYLSGYDPFLTKLRGDARFQEILARVKGEWERFEV
jgi:serine/threonine protein kinase/tetratricopeptide (TPR) repeat protein